MIRALKDGDREVLAFITAKYITNGDLPPVNGNVRRWINWPVVRSRFQERPELEFNWTLFRLMQNDFIRREGPAFYNSTYHAADSDMYVPTEKGMMFLWT